nr:MAG TPA: hypothetical protein [Caudoviricetes sp.]
MYELHGVYYTLKDIGIVFNCRRQIIFCSSSLFDV